MAASTTAIGAAISSSTWARQRVAEEALIDSRRLVYDIFLGAVATVLLVLNVLEWLIPDDIGGSSGVLNDMLLSIIMSADNLVCGLFFIDFLVRHNFLRPKREKAKVAEPWHARLTGAIGAVLDLALCVPRCVLENGGLFSAVRVAREFRILQVMRVLMATRQLGCVLHEVRALSVVVVVAFLSFTVWLLGAIGVLAFEFEVAGSSIRTAEDALWWSAATITTVGYGDSVPITAGGRIIAFLLMLGGVSVYGATSGLMSSFIMGQATREEESMRLAQQVRLRQTEERRQQEAQQQGLKKLKLEATNGAGKKSSKSRFALRLGKGAKVFRTANGKPGGGDRKASETSGELDGQSGVAACLGGGAEVERSPKAAPEAPTAELRPEAPTVELRKDVALLRQEVAVQGESLRALHRDVAELSRLVERLVHSKAKE